MIHINYNNNHLCIHNDSLTHNFRSGDNDVSILDCYEILTLKQK